MRTAKRRLRKVIGRMASGELYTSEGAMRFGGLGKNSLAEARASGMVTPIQFGNRLYYEADELMTLVRVKGKKVNHPSLSTPADAR